MAARPTRSTTIRCYHPRRTSGRVRTGPPTGNNASGFVHVLDIVLKNQQIGIAVPIHLEAALVVPLDDARQGFSVLEDDDHRCLRLHLLYVIVVLSVGLVR